MQSLKIFETINKIRVNPLLLMEKINQYLINENSYLELIVEENKSSFKIPKKILIDIKQFLVNQKSVDCIMLDEFLYQIAVRNSNLISEKNPDSTNRGIIENIEKEYSKNGEKITEFILFNLNDLDPIQMILYLLEKIENREKFFEDKYKFGTVVCSVNDHEQYSLILFVNESKEIINYK